MTSDLQEEVVAWFGGRLPDDWFTGPPTVEVDREEIVVIGELADVETHCDEASSGGGGSEAAGAAARDARIARFREETRPARMRIADEAEHRFGRKVAWGARCGERAVVFTAISVPVMTRLRQRERRVLDTLVDAGVARSRSDALAWCVKLVGANEGDWITRLRESLVHVQKVREEGPGNRA
jgi:hypothetical protein